MTDAHTFYRSLPVKHLDLGDASLPYRSVGEGPDLILIHGFPLSGYTWRHLLSTLAKSRRCHVVDLAGLGDSRWKEKTDFTFVGHAKRLKAMADQLSLSSYDLLGQDTGATVARCLALLDPERARRVIMLNTEIPNHRPPWIVEYQLLMRLPGTLAILRLLLRSRAFRRSGLAFGGFFSNKDLVDGDFHTAFVQPLLSDERRLEGMKHYLLGIHWPTIDALATRHAEIREPALLIWGEDDPTFPLPRAEQMLPQFNDVKLVTIPNAKVAPHEERPAEVIRAVLDFLAA